MAAADAFSDEQAAKLRALFAQNEYASTAAKTALAEELGVDLAQASMLSIVVGGRGLAGRPRGQERAGAACSWRQLALWAAPTVQRLRSIRPSPSPPRCPCPGEQVV